MTRIRRIASIRFPVMALPVMALIIASAAASLALLACGAGLDMSNNNLPTPAISQGVAVGVCGSPTAAATLVLSDVGTGIIQNVPNLPPANAVHLVGTSTGLDPATHAVYILLVPIGANCPAYEQGVAVLNADGSFSGDLELPSDPYSVRAVAVAAPIGTVVSCASTDACVAAAGYLASSNALEIAK